MGMEQALTRQDNIISSYRTHPFAVLRGGTVVSLLGELLGRQCGISKGKGGSMHVFTESFQGGHGIVGAQVPLGAGLAFAAKYQEKPVATYTMYGDGASNQGQVFEAFNMVRQFEFYRGAPANASIFYSRRSCGTCRACLFAKTTSTVWVPLRSVARRTLSTTPVVTRSLVSRYASGLYPYVLMLTSFEGEWYGHPCSCQGRPAHQGLGCKRQWAHSPRVRHLPLRWSLVRTEQTRHAAPTDLFSLFVSCSMSDPGTTYRTREEVQRMRSTQDPIRGLQRYLEEWGLASEEELKVRKCLARSRCVLIRGCQRFDKDAKAQVDQAVEEAKASPLPEDNELWTDIYNKGSEPSYIRGREREEVSLRLLP